MKKKFLILILVLGLFVCVLCVGVNTYAWDESDDYKGSPIVNGEDFLNCSITLPSESQGGEYWFSNPSGSLFDIVYRFTYIDGSISSYYDRYYTLDCFYTLDSQGNNDDLIFGLIDLNDGFSDLWYMELDVYYYNSNNEKVSISRSHYTDIGGSDSDVYYYPLVNCSDYTGLNSTSNITYYIDYTGDYYLDDSIGNYTDMSLSSCYINNLASHTAFQYNGDDMLYLSSFNYVEPIGNQIADVMTGTFSLGTGILSALASYFNVFVLTDGNLSWITIFLFSLLGISLVIGMTRWLSSLIRRKI